ncbi:MAG: long-chain-acyl-CoA synthetase [Acidobacteriaceae bacterium]
MSAIAENETVVTGRPSQAWLRALELTAPIIRNPRRLMPGAIEEMAAKWCDVAALLSDRECFTYGGLAARQNQFARWGLAREISKGDVICLLMTNRPEYMAIWLGLSKIGAVTALINTNLTGQSLAHSINIVNPKHVIVASEFIDRVKSVLRDLTSSPEVWAHGSEDSEFNRIDSEVEKCSSASLDGELRRSVTIEDQALYIYTSGTTGMPKAAKVSHARVLQWGYWFAGMLQANSTDRIYNCLPMYHSIGGVLVPGALLAAGGSVVIRERFSCSQFWKDIRKWDCTMFQYIGELCRYLLHGTTAAEANGHRIRIACGNGMASDVWEQFKIKFDIPRILEFYASTEGGVSLFNVEGKHGAIGRVPQYLAHRLSPELVKVRCEDGEPVRNQNGQCIRCGVNEPGEALGKMGGDPAMIGIRFDGYSDSQASEKKILRNAFSPGDAWLRTGDLMRRDSQGYYYFVDRMGDTFRWKGENVSTTEVSEVINAYPGIEHANVYGVSVPGTEGAAGMAALVTNLEVDLDQLREYLNERLPAYSRPLFVRIQRDMGITGTFKYSKADLKREGYNVAIVADPLFFYSQELQAFVPVDVDLYQRLQTGRIRL